jgi:hypothetical protein
VGWASNYANEKQCLLDLLSNVEEVETDLNTLSTLAELSIDMKDDLDEQFVLRKLRHEGKWFTRSLERRRKAVNGGAARDVVGIRRGAIFGNMKVSFQAARSIG